MELKHYWHKDIFCMRKDRRLNDSEDPNNYAEACQEAIDNAEEDLSAYGDIYQ